MGHLNLPELSEDEIQYVTQEDEYFGGLLILSQLVMLLILVAIENIKVKIYHNCEFILLNENRFG